MKLVSRVTLIACYACAFAIGAGCASGDLPSPAEEEASALSEELVRSARGGRPGRRPRPPVNPCALVLCAPDTTCEVVDGDAVCTPNEPSDEVFCGGFAGIECPGAGQCFDDPSDDCDPDNGGADCSGVCDCSGVLLLCIPGTVFDDDPNVCACVPQEPEVDACAAVRCREGTHCEVVDGGAVCVPDENPCNLVDCPPDRPVCEVQDGEAVCVSAENPCNLVDCPPDRPVCEVQNGEAVCVAAGGGGAPFCGGIAAFECPGAGQCVDDTSDDCDPENGGADCGGVCDCSGVLLLCIEGTVFDDDPNVCACVPQEPEPDPCDAVRCRRGTRCEVRDGEAVCVRRRDGRR